MTEIVGSIAYDVTLETRGLVNGQREVDRRLGSMERRGEAFAARMTAVASAVKLLAVAMVSVKLAQTADDFRMLQARVNVATQSITAGAEAFGKLRDISTRTRSALADNVTIFARLNPSIVQMGGNANDTLRVVELLGKAITVSGASAAEKSSALLQFGQALGSGKLAGDELRSLLESAPYLMKQLADGLGVPIGQLKSLGEQGKLTADVVVEALGKSAERIEKDFASFPITLGGAFTVARDALTRLSERLDSFMGSSTMLTGVVTGIGKAVSGLADVFDRLGGAADATAKKDNIKSWANSTATVLSYVVDAADFVTRGFQQVGTGLGGLAASAAILAEGKLSASLATLGQTWKDVQDIGNRPFAGAQMRQAWAAGDGAAAPPDAPMTRLRPTANTEDTRRNAARRASAQAYYEGLLADTRSGLAKIDAEEAKALQENARRAAADVDNAGIYARAKTLIVQKFARERALLQEQYAREAAAAEIAVVTDEQERILKIRQEAFREADADVRLGVKTVEQAEQAKRVAAFQFGLAMVDAADRAARAEFEMHLAMTENAEERIALIERETVRAAELAFAMGRITEAELAAARARASRESAGARGAIASERKGFNLGTLELRASTTGSVDDQAAVLRARAEQAREDALRQKVEGIASEQEYADRIVEINRNLNEQLRVMRGDRLAGDLAAASSGFAALTDALRSETGKQDALYRASFLAQKAFAIASAIVNIQKAMADASASAPFPANLAAMATVAANTASIIATIKSTNYGGGRQFGGPVSAGSMYRVNESGRPEMFTAANGAQYMLPTRDGRVTSADRVGQEAGGARGGQARPISVVNHFHISGPADLRTQQQIAAAAARGLQAASMRNN